jgi:ubiquinol-cytochrome c reductase cytochrome b subunit
MSGRNPNIYIGGVILFLFAMQVASGVLLLLHYQSSAEHSFESVARIAGEYPYGDLVRGVHFWSGQLLVGTLLFQLVLSALRRTFTAPRELVWVSGVMITTVAAAFAFTGSVLPWTDDAYAQARVGSQMAGYVPLIGGTLLRLLRGGDEVTSMTLQKVYGFHVAVLPALFTLLLAVHIYTIRSAPRVATSPEAARDKIPMVPDFAVRMAAVLVGMLVVVISLATFVTRPLGFAADATAASPATARPTWFLLPVHALLKSAPTTLLGVDSAQFIGGALTGLYLLVAALPFVDKRGSRVTAGITYGALVLAALLMIHALY